MGSSGFVSLEMVLLREGFPLAGVLADPVGHLAT